NQLGVVAICLFLFPQSVLLPARRHTDLGIAPDRFSVPPQTRAALLSADLMLAAGHPAVRGPGRARRARQDACPEYPPHPLRVVEINGLVFLALAVRNPC